MFRIFSKKEKLVETEFSKFIRTASSGEKKKVFNRVINKATEDQRKVMGY
ncbi:MAG: hypothetical protein RLY43_44 [Bacteroidota bacterium]|jgi:hypothetical protein